MGTPSEKWFVELFFQVVDDCRKNLTSGLLVSTITF